MIRTILIDDERHALESLELLLERLFPDQFEILDKCQSVDQAIPAIRLHQPDLIFLDIQMPQKSGIALLELFPNRTFDVILTTAHQDYTIKGFKHAVFDYLLKPIDSLELQATILRWELKGQQEELSTKFETVLNQVSSLDILAVSSQDRIDYVHFSEILYLKADRNYTEIFLEGNKHLLVSKALGQMIPKLPTTHFLRIHQSIVVNLTKIRQYDKNENYLILKNGEKLSVSIRKNSNLSKRFA
jgi:two-component system, LytTR family, response regulator